jgi:hypothetical protein
MGETTPWFRLPLKLRQRWWAETEYGAKPVSDELRRALDEAFVEKKILCEVSADGVGFVAIESRSSRRIKNADSSERPDDRGQ